MVSDVKVSDVNKSLTHFPRSAKTPGPGFFITFLAKTVPNRYALNQKTVKNSLSAGILPVTGGNGSGSKRNECISLVLLCTSAVLLVAVENFIFGSLTFVAGLVSLLYNPSDFAKNMVLVYWGIALLAIAPINTSTEPAHVILLGLPMALALFTPVLVGKYIYKNNLVKFTFNFGRKWARAEIFYYLLIIFIAYLIMPIILQTGGSYLNWNITSSTRSLLESFVGLNAVAIWEEIFFVSVVFGIFRRHFTLLQANIAQAVLFTSFLFNMGFVGWCPLFIYIFVLSQGFLYARTKSLAYLLAIHLSIDVILHLTLVNLHNPSLVPIFITG